MTNTCLNCGTELKGKYCHVCGQENKHAKIDWHFVWHDIQHGLLHIDKGILYTCKELLLRPGYSIKDYLQGKRVKHFKPISFVIVLAGLYGFLTHYFDISLIKSNVRVDGSGTEAEETRAFINTIAEWIGNHYTIVTLIQIPFFTISTYLFFRKSGYNFVEHFIFNSYVTGIRLLLHLAVFPVYYFFKHSPALVPFAQATDMLSFVVVFWAMYQFFSGTKPLLRSLKIFLSFLATMGMGILLLFIVAQVLLPAALH